MKCPICKCDDGCRPTGLWLGLVETLTKENWKEIHHHYKYVFLPLIHRLVYRSENVTNVKSGNIDDSLLQLEHIQQMLKWQNETPNKDVAVLEQQYTKLKMEIENLWIALLGELLIDK